MTTGTLLQNVLRRGVGGRFARSNSEAFTPTMTALRVSFVIYAISAILTGGHAAENVERPGLVPFQLGPVTIYLPGEQRRLSPAGGGLVGSSIRLEYLLPNFDPRTTENESEFDKPGWNSRISIFLEYPPNIKPVKDIIRDTLEPRPFRGINYPIELKSDIEGFRKFNPGYGNMFYISAAHSDFYLSCSTVSGPDYASLPPISCAHSRLIWAEVYMRYNYAFKYAGDAIAIDRQVKRLTDSLRVQR